ncbi:hypothetical protein LZP73_01520 [Shewanella sp. AS16]|uniref:hypothetical protein n=1 Tax=Shewanella sp. AS16 TaxID=2907625 RepID=UPI001F264B34|nr:hypothetical protein [Shewanella sp. AS16]MCE9684889.1 hypothetical protein [Shewanella sp. AS16]
MQKVTLNHAIQAYQQIRASNATLKEMFTVWLRDNKIGEPCVDPSYPDVFEILGKKIQITLTPCASDRLLGKVAFNLFELEPDSGAISRQLLFELYLDSFEQLALKMSQVSHYEPDYLLTDEYSLKKYLFADVLKAFFAHYGVETIT